MSSIIRVTNVDIDNPEGPFTEGYSINIAFEAMEPLNKDINWKIIYIGHPNKEEYDQTLEDIEMPVSSAASFKFNISTEAPELSKIPKGEILGVTALLISCHYDGKEFFRVGYYVNTYYLDPELNAEPPSTPIIEKLMRSVLKDQPRVTNFHIEWDTSSAAFKEEFKMTDGQFDTQAPSMNEGFGESGFGASGFGAPPSFAGFGQSMSEINNWTSTDQPLHVAYKKDREAMMSEENLAKISGHFKDSKNF